MVTHTIVEKIGNQGDKQLDKVKGQGTKKSRNEAEKRDKNNWKTQ